MIIEQTSKKNVGIVNDENLKDILAGHEKSCSDWCGTKGNDDDFMVN